MDLAGDVVMFVNETSNAIDLLRKIKELDLSENEKSILFLHIQYCGNNVTKKMLLDSLNSTRVFKCLPDHVTDSKIISELEKEFRKIDKNEIEIIIPDLISKIEKDDEKFSFIFNQSM